MEQYDNIHSYNFGDMAQKFLPNGRKPFLAMRERAPRVPA
jgi:hypothetical protein